MLLTLIAGERLKILCQGWCREVSRGVPTIKTAAEIAELFGFLSSFTGGKRNPMPAGFLIPYFALATFAGLRPSIPGGELWKLGHAQSLSRLVDFDVGVIRITPEIAKTGAIRQARMCPNLVAWLRAYPLETHPLVMPNMAGMLTDIREKFSLGADVLRHYSSRCKSLASKVWERRHWKRAIRRRSSSAITSTW
jgi:hypothetical protein